MDKWWNILDSVHLIQMIIFNKWLQTDKTIKKKRQNQVYNNYVFNRQQFNVPLYISFVGLIKFGKYKNYNELEFFNEFCCYDNFLLSRKQIYYFELKF